MKRRLTAALAAATLAGSAIIASAQLASASGAGNCGSSRDLGTVCIAPYANGYNALYWNTTNHATYVDFNLWMISTSGNFGQRVGDQGAFTTQPGDGAHTYFFAVGGQGCGEVVLY